jgi:ABC-2 type transport system permease protein
MNAFATHFSFEFGTGLRNRSLLLMNYLLPLGFYAVMGGVMAEINPPFRQLLIPAMVVFAVLSGAMLGLPGPLVSAREAGIFRSYRINGVPTLPILAIPALTTLLHVAVTSAIVVVTAPVLFGAPLPTDWPSFALVFLLMAAATTGLGLLVGVVSSSNQITVLWSQLVYLPSIMLGGMMVPTSMLPVAFRKVGLLLPTTYAMNAFQGLLPDGSATFDPTWSVAILAAGAVLAFGLAIYLFNWDNRNSTRRGHPLMGLLALAPYVVGAILL